MRDDDGTFAFGLAEVATTGMARHVVENPAESLALIIGTLVVAHEVEVHILLLEHDFLDAQLFALHAERHHADQFLGHRRDSPKTVL